jgi:dTDP-4-dehydrorhamnose reductase
VKRVAILGAGGQLGTELRRLLAADHAVHPLTREQCDVTRPETMRGILERLCPEIVLNCAAYTRVDDCERDPAQAFALNATAVGHLAALAPQLGFLLVHFSTDYVFDGAADRPYREDDPPNPLSVYGRSKLSGERPALALGERSLVVRTQWLYGPGPNNFVNTILSRARRGERLAVVDDQWGSPTSAADVAIAVRALVERRCWGLYHVANAGETTWHGFACKILELAGVDASVSPASTDRTRYPAPRPAYAVLDTAKLALATGHRLRPWEEALADFLRTGETPESP